MRATLLPQIIWNTLQLEKIVSSFSTHSPQRRKYLVEGGGGSGTRRP